MRSSTAGGLLRVDQPEKVGTLATPEQGCAEDGVGLGRMVHLAPD